MNDSHANLAFAAKAADVRPRTVVAARVGERAIALYNLAGRYFATDDRCTHVDVPLSKGRVCGHRIECPLHVAYFDIATGRALGVPATRDVRTYPVRVIGDDLFIELPAED